MMKISFLNRIKKFVADTRKKIKRYYIRRVYPKLCGSQTQERGENV